MKLLTAYFILILEDWIPPVEWLLLLENWTPLWSLTKVINYRNNPVSLDSNPLNKKFNLTNYSCDFYFIDVSTYFVFIFKCNYPFYIYNDSFLFMFLGFSPLFLFSVFVFEFSFRISF
jgi:hypothetical protein